MADQINASGEVAGRTWADLTPFAQGYVEALLSDFRASLEVGRRHPLPVGMNPRFSDLASETLERIVADCAKWREVYPASTDGHAGGDRFWGIRQAALVPRRRFPPVTPYLGDDGKVYLREAAQ